GELRRLAAVGYQPRLEAEYVSTPLERGRATTDAVLDERPFWFESAAAVAAAYRPLDGCDRPQLPRAACVRAGRAAAARRARGAVRAGARAGPAVRAGAGARRRRVRARPRRRRRRP